MRSEPVHSLLADCGQLPAGATRVVVRRSPTASSLALALGLLGGAVELLALWRARLTWRVARSRL